MSDKNSPLILGTEPIGKLLTQYAIPAIIAMTASSLYNMADSIFIGHGVGAMGIAGLALTFPLMNLAAAFGSLVGVGASTLVSVKLGQKDYEGANNVLGNVFMLNLIMGVAFSVVFLLFLDPVLYFFGASEQTISYARDYMRIILYGNVITHMYLGLNSVLRSSGYPKMAMFATLLSVVVNCLLNPLFIFVLDWGIKGAAWATVFSQLISLIGQFIHFSRPTHEAFMDVNETEGAWNWGNMQSINGVPLIVGDSLYFYSSGRRLNKIMWDSYTSTGLATLRRDGFVSMRAGREEGTLTTEKLSFDGKYFFVNADVKAKKAQLAVELLDEQGTPIPGFTKKDCVVMKKADSTKQLVTWKNNADLSSLKGKVIRAKFYLTNGDLYAFWISPWQSGESRGYTAGGGPGLNACGVDRP